MASPARHKADKRAAVIDFMALLLATVGSRCEAAGVAWAAVAPGAITAVSTAVVVVLFLGGVFAFRRMEPGFADVV
jgi:hypothetical protein